MQLTQFLRKQENIKILLIRLSAIGDVLHASPVAGELKKAFPKASISWVVETKAKDVIEGNSNLDKIFVWPRKEWNQEVKETGDYLAMLKLNMEFANLIRKEKFDISIDLHGMLRSGLLSYLCGAKYRLCIPNPPERANYLANVRVEADNVPTVFSRYLSVLKPFGIESSDPVMEMPASNEDERFAEVFLRDYGLKDKGFFVLNPSTSQPGKCWPTESFAKLGDRLGEACDLPIVIFGAVSDRPLAREIAVKMKNPPVDATGLMNLKQLGAVTRRARVFISGDTGPLYIAQAVETPTVAIFGPTDSSYYSLGLEQHIGIQGYDHNVQNVSVEEVFQAVERLNKFVP